MGGGALPSWFGSRGKGRGLLSSIWLRKDAELSLGWGPPQSGLIDGSFFRDAWLEAAEHGDAGPVVATGVAWAGPAVVRVGPRVDLVGDQKD